MNPRVLMDTSLILFFAVFFIYTYSTWDVKLQTPKPVELYLPPPEGYVTFIFRAGAPQIPQEVLTVQQPYTRIKHNIGERVKLIYVSLQDYTQVDYLQVYGKASWHIVNKFNPPNQIPRLVLRG